MYSDKGTVLEKGTDSDKGTFIVLSKKIALDVFLGVDKDPIMFENLETNRPNTNAKFKLEWISSSLKSCDIKHTNLWIYYLDRLTNNYFRNSFILARPCIFKVIATVLQI